MKIWVDAREFTPRGLTGIARYIEHLFSAYISAYSDEIVLLTYHPQCLPACLSDHCDVVQLPQRMTAYVDHVIIPRIIGRSPDDIFFSPYYKTPLTGYFKRISVIHDILFLRRNDLPMWKRILTLLYLRMCARKTNQLLVSSQFTKRDVGQVVKGVGDKLEVLYPDLSAVWFANEKTSQHELDAPYFLYVGNFNPHKNVPLLIKGFAAFKTEHPTAKHHLILAGGDKRNMQDVQACIQATECGDEIQIMPHISDEKLKTLYAGATGFVTASSYEGFGYPVVEAMACRCPVICSAETSLGEISGGCAVTLSSFTTDSVCNALRDIAYLSETARKELVDSAYKHIAMFAPGTAAMRLHGLLNLIQ